MSEQIHPMHPTNTCHCDCTISLACANVSEDSNIFVTLLVTSTDIQIKTFVNLATQMRRVTTNPTMGCLLSHHTRIQNPARITTQQQTIENVSRVRHLTTNRQILSTQNTTYVKCFYSNEKHHMYQPHLNCTEQKLETC